MTSHLTNELRSATRALLRDNWLCQSYLRQLRRNETLDSEQLDRMQATYLHRTLQTAIARLPFYSNISPDFSVDEAREVLRTSFPIIAKDTLLANPKSLYANRGGRRPWQALGRTSGTTGTPLTILRSIESLLLENAFVKRHWAWAGFQDGMTRATLRGDMVVSLKRKEPPFWFWNRYNRQLLVSSRHLTDANADAIINRLEALAPSMMQSYPSTAFTLATHLARRNRYLRLPYTFTASEPLYPHQRELVLERLGGKIMDMYGMAERVAFATQCEHGEMHINPDYSYVEIVDEQGRPTDDYGYVVGTTFHNYAMPLVRYRLSDCTRWKPGRCTCGRSFPMIESVTGKFEDSITGSDGAVVSPSVLTFAFKGVKNIRKSQVAQVGPGSWELRLVPFPEFSAADQDRLVDNIHKLVDAHVAIKIVLKTELPETAAGKFRWVVNETANCDLGAGIR
jgi:phenylacetate-CoA ligase